MDLLTVILQIDPSKAVENISLNNGVLGSMFILILSFLVGAVIFIRKSFISQLNEMRNRLDKSENNAKESNDRFLTYLQEKNAVFVDVIKEYSETRDASRVVMEKLLMKL